jgi:translation initiation factor IF-3
LSYPSRSFQPREPKYRRNGKIRAREVRVLDENKQQLGVMSLSDALRLAQSKGLDLMETVPNATPPVCRIVNYGKLQYEEAKLSKEVHSRRAATKMKEIQLSPSIEAHDFETKLGHAVKFLSEDMRVAIKLRFRGRQRAHKTFGFEVMARFLKEAEPFGQAAAPPKLLGDRDLSVVINPLPREKRPKAKPASSTPSATPSVAAPVKVVESEEPPAV